MTSVRLYNMRIFNVVMTKFSAIKSWLFKCLGKRQFHPVTEANLLFSAIKNWLFKCMGKRQCHPVTEANQANEDLTLFSEQLKVIVCLKCDIN
jgi:hypothetical protein